MPGVLLHRTGNKLQTIVGSGFAVELSRDDLPVRAGILRAVADASDQGQPLGKEFSTSGRGAENFSDLSGAEPAGVA
jgi:hypothetical protein